VQLIDTHAHVCFEAYDTDRNEVLQRAYQEGIKKLIHPCCNLEELQNLIDLAKKYQGDNCIKIFSAIGVHPTEFSTWDDHAIDFIEEALNKPDYKKHIKAIGEAGLDYYHVKSPEEQKFQQEIFIQQISIAQKYNLPIIVHTRDAWEDTLEILKTYYPKNKNANSGVLHCYTGDLDFALSAIELGFYISWSGVLTYNKNTHFRDIAGKLDIEKVLIETDCPFLAPQQVRGKRNEPSYVRYVAEVLAQCYALNYEQIAEISTKNAERLFKI
jgi:TatD DNase family protein